jgi:large subunit ribosomal protein L5
MTNQNPAINLSTASFFTQANDVVTKANPKINVFDISSISSVTINTGVGKFDNKQKQDIADTLARITCQTPKKVASRVSIATFKLRKGDTVGYTITLRGQKARDFLFQLIYIAIPRTRDFKGIKLNSFDSKFSTYSLGIENASIFPAVGFDNNINFGLQVNIKFRKLQESNLEYLQALNFPFKSMENSIKVTKPKSGKRIFKKK